MSMAADLLKMAEARGGREELIRRCAQRGMEKQAAMPFLTKALLLSGLIGGPLVYLSLKNSKNIGYREGALAMKAQADPIIAALGNPQGAFALNQPYGSQPLDIGLQS